MTTSATVSAPAIFLVDDDAMVRHALARLLRTAGYRVAAFSSAAEFLEFPLDAAFPACLVLDVRMPDLGGLDLQRELNATSASLPIIFITGHDDTATTVRAMKAGAADFLAKPVEDTDLLLAVEKALHNARQALARRAELAEFRQRLDRLTPREREVLALLLNGLLNKQVAGELGISEKTIKVHRARVMEKMAAHSLVELARATDKAGIALLPAQAPKP
ncbi:MULTISPECIES: response regulator transcription factor [unclassified Achromobacter]|uniref:response regulator transcription factor n=1 Tax=unclassified Achromobacter TaxID=2626865 RepID=UPI002100E422|nr:MULTISPECIES: response regulator [unclassified Achromobacter]